MLNTACNPSVRHSRELHWLIRVLGRVLLAVTGLVFVTTAPAATLYAQTPVTPAQAHTINSNAVTSLEGSDQDVVAYDNFKLNQAITVTAISWRGKDTGQKSLGFTIKIYLSKSDPAAGPDTGAPVGNVHIIGNAAATPVGNDFSDYRASFTNPLVLQADTQYWVSIVADKNDLSTWGWADGTGGDGKSIQSYREFKVLPAPGDRAFELIGVGATP